MRRTMVLCVILGAAAFAVGTGGTALAGAGCHTGATEDDASGQEEATVRMIDACFTASVTHVDPGTAVTFVNDDVALTHNVAGTEWGHFEDMTEGDAFTATFDEPGVYPFACSYHPGMTGAIVVGDGKGAGTGSTVVEAFDPPEAVAPVVAEPSSAAGWIVAIGALGLGIGAGAGFAFSRTRIRTVTS